MSISEQIAAQFRAVFFGGNWTAVNLKESLADVCWQDAVAKPYNLNSIAALVFHIDYYIAAVSKVLEGNPLDAHDKYSFDLPGLRSEEDWQLLLQKSWANAEHFARLVERLPEEKLMVTFDKEKYGNYYRNLHGVIQHAHYHLGQIVLIKKLLAANTAPANI